MAADESDSFFAELEKSSADQKKRTLQEIDHVKKLLDTLPDGEYTKRRVLIPWGGACQMKNLAKSGC